jgi:hypothetical protein
MAICNSFVELLPYRKKNKVIFNFNLVYYAVENTANSGTWISSVRRNTSVYESMKEISSVVLDQGSHTFVTAEDTDGRKMLINIEFISEVKKNPSSVGVEILGLPAHVKVKGTVEEFMEKVLDVLDALPENR